MANIRNIVLVHGGFVDGSGWHPVYKILTGKGFNVRVVQNPTLSLADDVAVTKRAIASSDGAVILVGHSYGGAVVSEAGTDPKVKGLVYIAAFAPDRGESVSSLIANPAPGAPVPPILPPQDGFLFLDRSKFAASFAADVDPELAAFMADSQVPWGVEALAGAVSNPAWRSKPSWYLVTADDKMIPPSAQRSMAQRAESKVVETAGSHAVYVSKPNVVAELIARAASEAQ
ncbi:MAG TPA: alpha/beta hydrolase [Steroidobacteraceae bacterium]|jgi:pimeloyl-ACP methyl ester carboxylesterase|nr:alpha/beta hydrolase [Steroidobacteraceae bacterium]